MLRNIFLLYFYIVGTVLSVNAQSSWVAKSAEPGRDLVAIWFNDSNNGWIAGDGGYLASTKDGGKSWVKYELNMTEDINEIYFRNDDNGYLVAGRKLFITSDRGRTWRETSIYKPNDFGNSVPEFLSIRFSDKKRGLAIGSLLNKRGDTVVDSLVMRTADGGATWQRVVMPTKAELFDLDFNGSSHAWIVGDKGLILATTDSGATWQVQKSGTMRALFNVDFRDDSEGYAVGGKGTILRTEDGGANWAKVNAPFTETFKRVDFADDKNGWIVGFGGSVLSSSDKGKTWVKQESGTKNNLYGLFMAKKYGWAIGENGVILEYKR